VHFEWQEGQTDPGSRWYLHKVSCFWYSCYHYVHYGSLGLKKSNGPGLSYEVCVDAVKERIVWTNDPFPAATHDITIFCGGTKKNDPATWHKSSLFHKMIVEKRLVDDSGYYNRVLIQYSDCIQNRTISVGIQSWHNYCRNTVRNFLTSRNTVALVSVYRPRT
jgi:hypothetical protein